MAKGTPHRRGRRKAPIPFNRAPLGPVPSPTSHAPETDLSPIPEMRAPGQIEP